MRAIGGGRDPSDSCGVAAPFSSDRSDGRGVLDAFQVGQAAADVLGRLVEQSPFAVSEGHLDDLFDSPGAEARGKSHDPASQP